jgi:hypothetical protein
MIRGEQKGRECNSREEQSTEEEEDGEKEKA